MADVITLVPTSAPANESSHNLHHGSQAALAEDVRTPAGKVMATVPLAPGEVDKRGSLLIYFTL